MSKAENLRPLELAKKFMGIFFSGQHLDELGSLLSNEFTFEGPLYKFDNGLDYIESLKDAPPIEFQYSVIAEYENELSACLVYQFSKPGISVPMAQQFEITNGKISHIQLIFDSRNFT